MHGRATVGTRRRLGEILLELGLLDDEQLEQALDAGRSTGRRLGEVLLEQNFIAPADLLRALAAQFDIDFVDLDDVAIDAELVQRVPANIARRHRAVPVRRAGNKIVVAMANPIDVVALDDLRNLLASPIQAVMADPDQIASAIEKGSSADSRVAALLREAADDVDDDDDDVEPADGVGPTEASESPIVRFVDLMLSKAIQDRASDIHIEPSSEGLRIRFRIDGVLRDAMTPPRSLQAGLLSRVKVMAELDIAERRRPQDGRTSASVGEESVDIRVATVPTVHGEAAVMRILRPEHGVSDLESVDLLPEQQEIIEEAITNSWGIVLVTGPTGSGKTTTLYAALQRLNQPGTSIVTVEDPVEYRLDGLKQVQVNTKAGLTFATSLRSFLRLDPDVMLVGEMRDSETAQIAVESSLTGHLVLSTLHTNDATSAPVRLIEMGIEPYLISAATLVVSAQRLVRRLCHQCRQPDQARIDAYGVEWPDHMRHDGELHLHRAVGCDRCGGTGYRGRLAIHEVMPFSERIGELVAQRAPASQIRHVAVESGMITLRTAGLRRVAAGDTTVEEVLRATTT